MSLEASQKILGILESLQDQGLLGKSTLGELGRCEADRVQKPFFHGTLTPYLYLPWSSSSHDLLMPVFETTNQHGSTRLIVF
jgi:hypothetical protein